MANIECALIEDKGKKNLASNHDHNLLQTFISSFDPVKFDSTVWNFGIGDDKYSCQSLFNFLQIGLEVLIILNTTTALIDIQVHFHLVSSLSTLSITWPISQFSNIKKSRLKLDPHGSRKQRQK